MDRRRLRRTRGIRPSTVRDGTGNPSVGTFAAPDRDILPMR
jgi:hypothetical protein